MREPSLTIKHSDLTLILNKLFKASGIEEDSEYFTKRIVTEAKGYPLKRNFIFTNSKVQKRLHKTTSDSVETFNRILESERTKAGHERFRSITKESPQYSILCTICKDATEFAALFDLSKVAGFRNYCRIGIRKGGKNYRLNKFLRYKDFIFETYEKKVAVQQDDNKEMTENIFRYYLEKLGIEHQADQVFELYAHDFVYAAEAAVSAKATAKAWVDIQFEAIKKFDSIPNPYNLHGEYAYKCYISEGAFVTEENWRAEALAKMKKL